MSSTEAVNAATARRRRAMNRAAIALAGVVVLGVAAGGAYREMTAPGKGAAAVKSFYEELDLRALGIYVDQNADALTKLGGFGIPLTVLVGRDGRELWRVIGPRAWDQAAEVKRIRSHLAREPKP